MQVIHPTSHWCLGGASRRDRALVTVTLAGRDAPLGANSPNSPTLKLLRAGLSDSGKSLASIRAF